MPLRYPWNRFWVRRDAKIQYDGGNLFAPPNRLWGKQEDSSVNILERLVDVPCLILLGQPGLGKSTALEQEAERLGEAGVIFHLDSQDAHELIFQDERLRLWKESAVPQTIFHLLIDGLDYGRLLSPDIGRTLERRFKGLPTDNLRLRITCRATEWLPSLETALSNLWGRDRVAVYHLASLSRQEIAVACRTEGIDPDTFFGEVGRVGAEALAGSPVTLRFLFGLLQKNQQLPNTRWETYEAGCRLLCEEENQLWDEARDRARKSEPSARFITASRMSFLCLHGNREGISDGHSSESEKDGNGSLLYREAIGSPDEHIDGHIA